MQHQQTRKTSQITSCWLQVQAEVGQAGQQREACSEILTLVASEPSLQVLRAFLGTDVVLTIQIE